MKKSMVVIFVLVLTIAIASLALAQENKLAFFKIDTDLVTAGFQGGSVVEGIGASQDVAFALYVKNVDQFRAYVVDMTWDGTKASMRSRDSGPEIFEDDVTFNGQDITLAEEANVLGTTLSVGEESGEGSYKNNYAKQGGDALVSDEYGLIYLLVIRTSADFTVDTSFTVKAKITVLNDVGASKFLGERDFYINGAVDVKTSTWGAIKTQFKD